MTSGRSRSSRAVRSCVPALLAVLCWVWASQPATVRPRPVSGSGTVPPVRLVEAAGGGGEPALQAGDLRGDRHDPRLQRRGVEGVEAVRRAARRPAARGRCCWWVLSGSCTEPIRHLRQFCAAKAAVEKAKTLWTDRPDCRTRVLLEDHQKPAVRRSGRPGPEVLRGRNVMRSGTTCRLRGMTQRPAGPGRPAKRPPPPRTPQDASARLVGTSCSTATSTAHAAGHKRPKPGASGSATHDGRPAGRPPASGAAQRHAERHHLPREGYDATASTGPGRPAARPLPPRTPQDATAADAHRDVLQNGHLRRARRRTQAPDRTGRPAAAT